MLCQLLGCVAVGVVTFWCINVAVTLWLLYQIGREVERVGLGPVEFPVSALNVVDGDFLGPIWFRVIVIVVLWLAFALACVRVGYVAGQVRLGRKRARCALIVNETTPLMV